LSVSQHSPHHLLPIQAKLTTREFGNKVAGKQKMRD
jgi:hypothetical protein